MNTRLQAFQDFLAAQSLQIPVWDFLINLFLAAVLGNLLGWIYIRYGGSLSNRKAFAQNFVLLAMTTTLIITIIKTSLALSLGLVGALSIVRFRAAIKEPSELTYLFLTIGIGLGLGAGQRLITLVAFVCISAFIIFRSRMARPSDGGAAYLTMSVEGKKKPSVKSLLDQIRKISPESFLKRWDDAQGRCEAVFVIDFGDAEQLEKGLSHLKEAYPAIEIRLIDNRGDF